VPIWECDFVEGRTYGGRKFRVLTIIGEASCECFALTVARQLKHEDVSAVWAVLFIARYSSPEMADKRRRQDTLNHSGMALGVIATTKATTSCFTMNCSTAGSSKTSPSQQCRSKPGGPTPQQPRLPTAGPINRLSTIAAFRSTSRRQCTNSQHIPPSGSR
jgi:hypothetical protein